MRVVCVAAVLALVTLAGCAEDSGSDDGPEQTAVDDELKATDDTGVIRGVVVDETVTPVVGATVKLLGPGLSTTSTEDGSFGFSELDPGTYFMEVSKPGYDSVQSSAEVVAGVDRPGILRVLMTRNETSTPYVSISQFNGNLRCGIASPAVSFGCSVVRGTEDLVGEYNGEVKEFDVIPDWIQVEMFWESTQPAGESLYVGIRHCCDNEQLGPTAGSRGPSPQTVWANKTALLEHDDGAVVEDGVELSAFPAGLEALQENGVRAGVILDQKFEWFVIQFFNFTPDEGWTFIADGAHPVPT